MEQEDFSVAFEWVNGLGQSRWQPFNDEFGLCYPWNMGKTWGDYDSDQKPVLYRSKKKAIRVARRKQRQRDRHNWTEAM